MSSTPAFAALGDERFISLTTFRRSGDPVSTPVWMARDGDHLIVTTPQDSGKVKRLRNSGRVELRPCDRMGRVRTDEVAISGEASVLDDAASLKHLAAAFSKKYGFEYRLFMLIERLGKSGRKAHELVRIVAD